MDAQKPVVDPSLKAARWHAVLEARKAKETAEEARLEAEETEKMRDLVPYLIQAIDDAMDKGIETACALPEVNFSRAGRFLKGLLKRNPSPDPDAEYNGLTTRTVIEFRPSIDADADTVYGHVFRHCRDRQVELIVTNTRHDDSRGFTDTVNLCLAGIYRDP